MNAREKYNSCFLLRVAESATRCRSCFDDVSDALLYSIGALIEGCATATTFAVQQRGGWLARLACFRRNSLCVGAVGAISPEWCELAAAVPPARFQLRLPRMHNTHGPDRLSVRRSAESRGLRNALPRHRILLLSSSSSTASVSRPRTPPWLCCRGPATAPRPPPSPAPPAGVKTMIRQEAACPPAILQEELQLEL